MARVHEAADVYILNPAAARTSSTTPGSSAAAVFSSAPAGTKTPAEAVVDRPPGGAQTPACLVLMWGPARPSGGPAELLTLVVLTFP